MIYTVTFQPSLDYSVTVNAFHLGDVNRSQQEAIEPGGKGFNVSILLWRLGMDTEALGFAAGFTGREIEARLRNLGVSTQLIWLENGFSRINIKIKGGQETEINANGPPIGPKDLERLFHQLEKIKDGDGLVISGSIPPSLPEETHERLLKKVSGKKIRTVVDAEGPLLLYALRQKPFLIKPNEKELLELTGADSRNQKELYQAGRQLQNMGAQNVLVSLGSRGAVLFGQDEKVYSVSAPKGTVVSTVGSGDSMVAGFLAGYEKTGSLDKALKMGAAAGSATAFTQGIAQREEVETLYFNLTGDKI